MRRHVDNKTTIQVRIDRELHWRLRLESVKKKVSIGQLISMLLASTEFGQQAGKRKE